MDIKDFQRLLLEHEDKLNYAVLNFPGVAGSDQVQQKMPSSHGKRAVSFLEEARQATSTMYHNKERCVYKAAKDFYEIHSLQKFVEFILIPSNVSIKFRAKIHFY